MKIGSRAALEGAFWMVLAGAAFAGVNTLEQIATMQAGLPAPTAAFLQYLVAFIVTRMKWRREMIRRGAARYNSQTGKWEWGEPPEKPKAWKVQ